MAVFSLTASGADSLVGADAEADVFIVAADGRLASTDTVQGGVTAFADSLRVTAPMTLAASAFANTRDLERLFIVAAAGANVTLDDAMVASTDRANFEVYGGPGGDTVLGGGVLATPLVMNGDLGSDLMEGGGGNDLLRPGSGADTMLGGAGADTVEIAFADLGADDRLDGGDGLDDLLRLTGGGGALGAAAFAALARFERIELDPAIAAALTAQVAAGYATSGAPLTIRAADGNDTLVASDAAVAVAFHGEGGNDRLVGGLFADTLHGGLGNDVLVGNAGNDVLEASDGHDRLSGMAGNDLLVGGAGNDTFSGGSGNDTIEAGTGTDRMDGGAGNDLYRFAALAFDLSDLVADESGNLDAVEFLGPSSVSISTTGSGRFGGIERVSFAEGNDTLLAGAGFADAAASGAMTLDGGAGNDLLDLSGVGWLIEPPRFLLIGGEGSDVLIGDDGADTLDGGLGGGRVSGGLGNDLVLFTPDALAAAHTIQGGDGFADVLRITAEGNVGAVNLANATGIESIEFGAAPVNLFLPAALIASMSSLGIDFAIRGGSGDDTVTSTDLLAGTDLAVTLGGGDDSFVGGAGDETVTPGTGLDTIQLGAGNDRVEFGANELSAADIVGADTLAGDTLEVLLVTGRTLPSSAFAGVTGIDSFLFETAGATSAVRLPSNLVVQSGQASVLVDVIGVDAAVVDGRAVNTGVTYAGGTGNDVLLAGSAADTLSGSSGEDTLVGGDGGDQIALGVGGDDRDLALIIGQFDGSSDINTSTSLTSVDRVTGLASAGNFIAADWQRLGLPNSTTLVISAGQDVEFGWGAIRFNGAAETIAANNFGSLTAVRNAVGSRITNNDVGVDERIILVIGGADGEEFGVYLFEDRDDNATVDSADGLYLLAIGDTGVPLGLGPGRGFTMTTLDLV